MVQLGRVEGPRDARDANHPMAAVLEPLFGSAAKIPASRYWYPGLVTLDQGSLGACVGFTGANWMQNSPTRTKVSNQVGIDLYRECKKIDGIPDQEGTYARALLEVLRGQGKVSRYLWASSIADVKSWVLGVGPVLVGTPWYDGMFDPDQDGTAHPTGQVVGGHEYLIRGYSRPLAAFRCRNSWGPSWGIGEGSNWAGRGGEFWVKEGDMESLIFGDWGDAIGIVEA